VIIKINYSAGSGLGAPTCSAFYVDVSADTSVMNCVKHHVIATSPHIEEIAPKIPAIPNINEIPLLGSSRLRSATKRQIKELTPSRIATTNMLPPISTQTNKNVLPEKNNETTPTVRPRGDRRNNHAKNPKSEKNSYTLSQKLPSEGQKSSYGLSMLILAERKGHPPATGGDLQRRGYGLKRS
jgi:ABC-type uncharacterized transport system involved in gliding motility auxiliary subunit